jgi:hypothetical protein
VGIILCVPLPPISLLKRYNKYYTANRIGKNNFWEGL